MRFADNPAIIRLMLQPLAIVFYERVMPGSQLANRLQDMKYRVLAVSDPTLLVATIRRESPLIVFVDLEASADICGEIEKLKADAATAHLPIVAFAPDDKTDLLTAARKAGASLIVGESRLAGHLPQLLEQALHVD